MVRVTVEPTPEMEALIKRAAEDTRKQVMERVMAALDQVLLGFLLWLQADPKRFYAGDAHQLVKQFLKETGPE